MLRTIWYHFYYLKNVKNTHGGVILLASACNFTKSITPPWPSELYDGNKLTLKHQMKEQITFKVHEKDNAMTSCKSVDWFLNDSNMDVRLISCL